MARWIKKSMVFAFTQAENQIAFIDQLRRKLKTDFHIQATKRGVTVTLRGAPEQVRLAVKHVRTIFRAIKESMS